MAKLRFGIIGCGKIAARFARAIAGSQDGELYACAARELARAKEFGERFGAEKCYGCYEELINDPAVDCIYIAVVNTAHVPAIKLCIAAHKPVICEKPMFVQSDDADALIEYARQEKTLLVEAMWTRMLPAFLKAKEWIREGRIGEVRLMTASFCNHVVYNEQSKNHRIFDPSTAGGSVLDVGVYVYEFFTGIMGEPPVKFTGLQKMHQTGVDESTSMTLQFQNGALAVGFSSIGAGFPDDAVISGPDGRIFLPSFWHARRAELQDMKGNVLETFTDDVEEGFIHEVNHFTGLVRSGALESELIPLKDTVDFIEKIRTCKSL